MVHVSELYNYCNEDPVIDYLVRFENLNDQKQDLMICQYSVDERLSEIFGHFEYKKDMYFRNNQLDLECTVPYLIKKGSSFIIVLPVGVSLKVSKNGHLSSTEKWWSLLVYCYRVCIGSQVRIHNHAIVLNHKTHGLVDLEDTEAYNDLLQKSLNWVSNLKEHGHNWTLEPPSKSELYPNMKNINCSQEINERKKEIALKYNEITLFSWCTYKKRKLAHAKNIYSWSDKRFKLNEIDMNEDSKYGSEVKALIDANKENKFVNFKRFTGYQNELFLDIETTIGDTIYLIGVAYIVNEKLEYKYWLADTLDDASVKKILEAYSKFTTEFNPDVIYIWHDFEDTMFKKVSQKFGTVLHNNKLFDFCKWVKSNKIGVPGAFSHKLKCFGKAMYNCGLVKSTWPKSEVNNGLQALTIGHERYMNNGLFDDIIEYNFYDVIVMAEIILYFKSHQT